MTQIRINHFDNTLNGKLKGYVEHHRDKRWVYLAQVGSDEAKGIKAPKPDDGPADPKDADTPDGEDGKKKGFFSRK